MSHTTAVKSIAITSITALRAAVEELSQKGIRISMVENEVPRAYFANQQGMGKADFVLKLADAKYDIGLYKQDNGSFEARTDFWGQSVENVLGAKATADQYAEQAKMGQLFQAYAVNATMEQARREGKMVQRRTDAATGKVQLVVTGF